MESLTPEQREQIRRNKAEADRRLALRMARLRAEEASAANVVGVVGQPSEPRGPGASRSDPSPTTTTFTHNLPSTSYSHSTPSSSTIISQKWQTSVPPQRPGGALQGNRKAAPEAVITYAKEKVSPVKFIPEVHATFHFIDEHRFKVVFFPFDWRIVAALKEVPSKVYDSVHKEWSFLLTDEAAAAAKLGALKEVKVIIERLPSRIVELITGNTKRISGQDEPDLRSKIESSLVDELYPFQQYGVSYGIKRRGRILLADEMGLGKSIQALGIARYFKEDWPLLIVCPSSVKFTWTEHIAKFLPSVNDVVVIEKGSDQLPHEKTSKTVVIMSYDLMVSKRAHIIEYHFESIIFDESHSLKDRSSQRTKVAVDVSRRAHRVILLSGTPALSRPSELFCQIKIIDPKIFPNFNEFAVRYCDGKQGKFGFEAKGCTNSAELSLILTSGIMIRRLKNEVLKELPEKRREVVKLSDSLVSKHMDALRKLKAAHSNAKDWEAKHECLVQYFTETGLAKAEPVANYIIDNFFYEDAPKRKVLVFAHHQAVLDTLCLRLAKKGIQSIRIDGSTASKTRDELCHLFQENEDVTVAVLSVTAAGVGISLTAASVVVFAELHWTPSILLQAEDRAHRMGQENAVFVQYLVAEGTADDFIWPMLLKKQDVLGSCQLASETYRDASSVTKVTNNDDGGIVSFFPVEKKRRRNEEDGDRC